MLDRQVVLGNRSGAVGPSRHVITRHKLRPVLVISPDIRNALASDVIVIPCTTTLSIAPTHVRLRRGEGGLSAASVLKCEQITTLHKDDVQRDPLGGALLSKRILEVERAVLRAIGVPVPLETD